MTRAAGPRAGVATVATVATGGLGDGDGAGRAGLAPVAVRCAPVHDARTMVTASTRPMRLMTPASPVCWEDGGAHHASPAGSAALDRGGSRRGRGSCGVQPPPPGRPGRGTGFGRQPDARLQPVPAADLGGAP